MALFVLNKSISIPLFTEFYRFYPSFTEFYRILTGFNGLELVDFQSISVILPTFTQKRCFF